MKTETIHTLTSSFESHAQKTADGQEFWLARDLQKLPGYSKWDNFLNIIVKAKISCETSGNKACDHFPEIRKTIQMPKGAQKTQRTCCHPERSEGSQEFDFGV